VRVGPGYYSTIAGQGLRMKLVRSWSRDMLGGAHVGCRLRWLPDNPLIRPA
jgi:hypothetical protein